MALLKVNPNDRALQPGIGQELNLIVKAGDFNPVVDEVNRLSPIVDALAPSSGTLEADIISEETSGAGVTVDGVLLKDTTVDVNGTADAIILDADGDTTISAPTDDQIDIEINGADDFKFTANTFTALTGSTIVTPTLSATTSATITSASADALSVGLAGATNSAFKVDSSTGSQAAGLKVTGAVAAGTVAAVVISSGSDASLSVDAKGTGTLTLQGTATGNIVVGDDIVPDVDNTLDIGNLASNHRDIHASRAFINKGVASTEGYGQLALKYKSASKTFAGGATEVIAVQVPAGAILVAAQLRNDTTLVGAGATNYSAAYSTGASAAISSGTNFVKNTKVTTPFNVNAATPITSGATDITLTPDAGTLDTGTVTAIVYYYELTSMTSAA